ncbi:MAG: hypothetical protein KGJ35_02170, partial [Patescibacteria group bacterium]|nr:hypothetical protein [Patescibacteria group bacterium]
MQNIFLSLLTFIGSLFGWHSQVLLSTSTPVSVNTQQASSSDGLQTYDNFGVSFQYPVGWARPQENFSNYNGSEQANISFLPPNYGFSVLIEPDTDMNGQPINETLDQMVSRFQKNDQYIYNVKDVIADGVAGKELFYNSAVSGEPYHVEAIFPFENKSYIHFSADYQAVSLQTFEQVTASIKWDNATAFKLDPTTGMAIYKNNGIKFEYPPRLNTDYAGLTVQTSVEKTDLSQLDSNGCYPGQISDRTGLATLATVQMINGIKFCTSTGGGVGAGQSYTNYSYETSVGDSTYTIVYAVHTSNGCGAYQGGPKYAGCVDFGKNYDSLVLTPIRQSIATI